MLRNTGKLALGLIGVGIFFNAGVATAGYPSAVDNTAPCPVNAAYPDKLSLDGTTLLGDVPTDKVIDAEFGAGAQAITQCLKRRHHVKIVVRVNEAFPTDAFGVIDFSKAMFFSNIDKMINQYENTHAMKIGKDVDIRVVFSGAGGVLATTHHNVFKAAALKWNAAHPEAPMAVSTANPYIDLVKKGQDAGMHFYLCQEASRSLGITMQNKIDGINFVPAAHAATADFQLDGYALVLP